VAKTVKSKKIDSWVRRHRFSHHCSCGCGDFVEIKRAHYRSGIPKFVKGHNFQGDFNPKTEEEPPPILTPWERLDESERDRRMSQLKNFPRGEEHPNWAGGVHITESGYKHLRMPDHPHAVDSYFPEHRLVVEDWLRENSPDSEYLVEIEGELYLKRGTVVHHRDENKLFNTISNLVLMKSQATHMSWHNMKTQESCKFKRFYGCIFCGWLSEMVGENGD